MPSITSAGLGSGLQVESLISQLMAVEQRPILQLRAKEAAETTKLSSWGQIKGVLSGLQTAAQALDARSEFVAYKGSIADSGVANASVSNTAVAGVYSIEVSTLADVQKIKSGGYATTATSLTADTLPATLTLEIGNTASGVFTADAGKTKTINIDSSNNSLAGVRDAINAAKGGVTASIVNDGGASPYRLVLTSDNTGTANTFKLSGLTDLSYNPATETGTGLSKIQSGTNAVVIIDGITVTKSSNTISDAIQGVTLSLTKTNIATPTKLTVTADTASIQNKVAAFVKAYNSVASLIKEQTSYNAETKVAGTLNGDSTARNIQSQLRSILSSTVGTGSPGRLSEVGVSFEKDGTLSFDTSKFQVAMNDKTKDVAGLFAKDIQTGIASQISSRITEIIGSSGLLTARTDGINSTIKNMDKRVELLSTRLSSIESRYRAQFTALDKTMSSLTSTSNFLTQQLSSLSNRSSSN